MLAQTDDEGLGIATPVRVVVPDEPSPLTSERFAGIVNTVSSWHSWS